MSKTWEGIAQVNPAAQNRRSSPNQPLQRTGRSAAHQWQTVGRAHPGGAPRMSYVSELRPRIEQRALPIESAPNTPSVSDREPRAAQRASVEECASYAICHVPYAPEPGPCDEQRLSPSRALSYATCHMSPSRALAISSGLPASKRVTHKPDVPEPGCSTGKLSEQRGRSRQQVRILLGQAPLGGRARLASCPACR